MVNVPGTRNAARLQGTVGSNPTLRHLVLDYQVFMKVLPWYYPCRAFSADGTIGQVAALFV